jgi:hypothetical protein
VTENYSAEVAAITARMLGPAGPELGCDECFDSLDRYVELELSGSDADWQVPGMRAHLEGCAACRNDHESMLGLLRHHTG